MLTQPDSAEKDDAVVALRSFIADGSYAPGDRLPPERKLIDRLGVTRTTLRKALDALEREGAIWRHVGKGTFVAATDGADAGGVSELTRQMTPVKMIRARLAIEPAIAREAAINASEEALVRIRQARDRAVDAPNWDEYEAWDDRLHRAIAEACDNQLLLSLFDQLNQVRRAVAWTSVIRKSERPAREHSSFAEHDAIVAAIETHDPHAAQDAMRRHIGSVSKRLYGEM